MRMQHCSCSAQPHQREVQCCLRRRSAGPSDYVFLSIEMHKLLGCETALIDSAGSNGDPQWITADHSAEVSARAQHPASRVEAASQFGQELFDFCIGTCHVFSQRTTKF